MPYTAEQLALAATRFRWRVDLAWRRARGQTRGREMSTLVSFYDQVWKNAARALSATVIDVAPGLWNVRLDSRCTMIHNYIVQLDDPVTLNIAGDKALCHSLLAARGLPIPEHATFTLASLRVAERFMAQHDGSRFVIKPAAGTSGARGVTTHVDGIKACRRASVLASLYGETLLIERWIPGESYRLLFLDGEMIHASRRRGWRVTGDGRSTIGGLMARDPDRRSDVQSPQTAYEIEATLRAQALDVRAVAEPRREVLLHSVHRLHTRTVESRTVFDEQATHLIGPGLRDEAARAVAAIGSRFAGVDLITTDPAVSLERSGGAINEINTTPGLHHHYGLDGRPADPDPAVLVLGRLLGVHEHVPVLRGDQ